MKLYIQNNFFKTLRIFNDFGQYPLPTRQLKNIQRGFLIQCAHSQISQKIFQDYFEMLQKNILKCCGRMSHPITPKCPKIYKKIILICCNNILKCWKNILRYCRRISNESDGSYFGTDLLEVERKQVRDGFLQELLNFSFKNIFSTLFIFNNS